MPATAATSPPPVFLQIPPRAIVEDARRRAEHALGETPDALLPQPIRSVEVLQRRNRQAAALALTGDYAGAYALLVADGAFQIRARRDIRLHEGHLAPGEIAAVHIDKAIAELVSGNAESADPALDAEMQQRGFLGVEFTSSVYQGGEIPAGERRYFERGLALFYVAENRATLV